MKTLGADSNADTILAISKIVIQLSAQGYSYYQATKMAKEQLGIQTTLNAQVINGVAAELWKYYNSKYPQLTVSDWIVYIQFGGDPSIPNGNNDIPKTEPNYWLYLAIFVVVMVVTKR